MADPTNVGVLGTNPNLAPSPAESEVTNNNPSAVVAPGAGAAPTTTAPSVPATLIDAVATFMVAVAPLVDQLKASFPPIDPAVSKHHGTVGPKKLQVVPMVAALLGTNPLLSGATPDDIDEVSNEVGACKGLSAYLKDLLTTVDDTGRLRLEYNWQVVSGALATARKQAPRNAVLAKNVDAIDAVLALGPRVDQAAHSAVTAQTKATKADARAAKANATLTAKTAVANALQHGTGDATVTQPAPSAPAPSTTALAATPGTPGSTPIR